MSSYLYPDHSRHFQTITANTRVLELKEKKDLLGHLIREMIFDHCLMTYDVEKIITNAIKQTRTDE